MWPGGGGGCVCTGSVLAQGFQYTGTNTEIWRCECSDSNLRTPSTTGQCSSWEIKVKQAPMPSALYSLASALFWGGPSGTELLSQLKRPAVAATVTPTAFALSHPRHKDWLSTWGEIHFKGKMEEVVYTVQIKHWKFTKLFGQNSGNISNPILLELLFLKEQG